MRPETKMLLAIIAYTAALFLGYGGVALAWYRGASYSISLACTGVAMLACWHAGRVSGLARRK